MPPSRPKATAARSRFGSRAWLIKTDVKKEFGLEEADLKALTPYNVKPSRPDTRLATKYLLTDVERLSRALDDGVGLNLPVNKGAREIMRTTAVKLYKISRSRLDSVLQSSKSVPVTITKKDYSFDQIATYYWLSDVKALAQQGENIAKIWKAEKSNVGCIRTERLPAPSPGRWLNPEEISEWFRNQDPHDQEYLLNRALHG